MASSWKVTILVSGTQLSSSREVTSPQQIRLTEIFHHFYKSPEPFFCLTFMLPSQRPPITPSPSHQAHYSSTKVTFADNLIHPLTTMQYYVPDQQHYATWDCPRHNRTWAMPTHTTGTMYTPLVPLPQGPAQVLVPRSSTSTVIQPPCPVPQIYVSPQYYVVR